jgi:hypothetical protein
MAKAKSTPPKRSSTRRTRMSIRKRRILKAPNRSKNFHREAGDHASLSVGCFTQLISIPNGLPLLPPKAGVLFARRQRTFTHHHCGRTVKGAQ